MSAALKRHDVDMTQGSILRHLIAFALPLMVGNIFQQLYNTVDSVVVGNFVSKQALAAVGSVGPVINTLVGFFSGFSVGVSVLISRNYGAKNEKGVHDAVHTSLLAVVVLSVFMTAAGVFLVEPLLRFMRTPDDVFSEAKTYLTIYFSGVLGLMLYNIGAGILRAVGDSRRPLYFLIFCTVSNTLLDLIFVVVFHWGVAGVAWATVIAQFLSAVLVLVVLGRSTGCSYRFIPAHLTLDGAIIKQIVHLGLPTALQMALTSFSNVFVQGYINKFGSACMAGWSSYGKLDSFALLPLSSISAAGSTFVGQNLGGGQVSRAKNGIKYAIGLAIFSMLILGTPLMVFSPQLVRLFNADAEVIAFGSLFIRTLTPFYLFVCVYDPLMGALRGAGETVIPTLLLMSGFIAARQIYLFFISRVTEDILPIALGYPLGWAWCFAVITLYYFCSGWEKRHKAVGSK